METSSLAKMRELVRTIFDLNSRNSLFGCGNETVKVPRLLLNDISKFKCILRQYECWLSIEFIKIRVDLWLANEASCFICFQKAYFDEWFYDAGIT